MASIELGQAHFEKNNQMQERLQRQKTMIVKRVINNWLASSLSFAFGAWAQAVEGGWEGRGLLFAAAPSFLSDALSFPALSTLTKCDMSVFLCLHSYRMLL